MPLGSRRINVNRHAGVDSPSLRHLLSTILVLPGTHLRSRSVRDQQLLLIGVEMVHPNLAVVTAGTKHVVDCRIAVA